jgi:iron-sulfur cluster repair protein YtfE (RIC family)
MVSMIRPETLFGEQGDTLSRPLDHLKACHRRIEERLDTLERIAAHIDSDRDEAVAALHRVFAFLDSSGSLHTQDEEESVFPRLTSRLERAEMSFVAGLEHDHTTAHQLYTELKQRAATSDFGPAFRGVIERLVAHYRKHIAKEDEILDSMCREKLTPPELAAISQEMVARRRT